MIGEIAARRLVSQQLLGPKSERPADVVKRLVAVQAQDFSRAKWALGLRMKAATDAMVERAFDRGTLLRTHVLRPTWHFVTPADIRWLLHLSAPRVHAINAPRCRRLGLEPATFRRSNAVLARELEGGRHLTRDELRRALQRAGIPTDFEQRMAYVMMHAELEGLVVSGPRRGKQFTYALLDERAPRSRTLDRGDALVELARRYFTSRGPATVQDFAKWSGLTVADAQVGLEGARPRLAHQLLERKTYWFSPARRGGMLPESPVVHLLSIYDEYVSSYRDKSAMIDRRGAARLVAKGAALGYIIVVAGRIVGTWSRRVERGALCLETELFARLSQAEQQPLDAAIHQYSAFLGMSVLRR